MDKTMKNPPDEGTTPLTPPPTSNSGKNTTPDRLKLPKPLKYPERYTSPTDQMMSPATRGILARSKKGIKLLPPSFNQPKIQVQEFGSVSN